MSDTRTLRGATWTLLIGMGGTSVTYNVWHAVHRGELNIGLALLYGLAPVFAAGLLSHIVAEHDGGKIMKAVTYTVMLAAMALSIGATASVVAPAAGPWMRWLFGGVLDAAALVALRVILDGRSHRAARIAELDEAKSAAEQARAVAEERTAATAGLETELAHLRAELAERDRTPAVPQSAPAAVVSMVPRVHPARTPGVPASRTPGTSQPVPGSAPNPLVEYAAELAVGEVPSVRRIKAEMNVGQKRAQEIQAELRRILDGGEDTGPAAVSQ
jgi:hypothetical protein